MASIADRMSSLGAPKKSISGAMSHEPEPEHDGGKQTTITHHEDGTHSVKHSDGDETGPHAHLHEAMAHISMKHHPDDAHSHVLHHEEGGHTSHHAKDGEVSGPHEHENLDGLKSHMAKLLDEEGHEHEHEDEGWS